MAVKLPSGTPHIPDFIEQRPLAHLPRQPFHLRNLLPGTVDEHLLRPPAVARVLEGTPRSESGLADRVLGELGELCLEAPEEPPNRQALGYLRQLDLDSLEPRGEALDLRPALGELRPGGCKLLPCRFELLGLLVKLGLNSSALGLVICEDGIYAIADWEFNQNVPAIDAMREGNRVRKASERARKNGKGTRQVKKDKVLAYLTEHPEATNTEVAEKTGVSRPSVIKYRKEYAPALPAPKGGKIVKDDGTKVDTVKIDGVKVDSFDSKVDVNFDVKVDSDFDTGFYTDADGKSAGRQSARAENEAVKIASRPKNIDDRYKNTSTSTAMADGEGATGSGIPTREEVRSHFAEMGFAVDPDRFFDVNEGRGWRTNSGKPVDDWKKLAAVWDRNERPKDATPPARTEPKANAVGKIPSVEEVMAKWGCDRETAQGYIDENMY